jgi:hypothetical protein
MTLEERVTRLEHRVDALERIEQRLEGVEKGLEGVEKAVIALDANFSAYRIENATVLGRILATLERLEHRPVFHWPWEPRP